MVLVAATVLQLGCASLLEGFDSEEEESKQPVAEEASPRARALGGVDSGAVAEVRPEVKRRYTPIQSSVHRATRDDFLDQTPGEGSLWASNGQTNYFFSKNKVHHPGDMVAIRLEDGLYQEIGAEMRDQLTPSERTIETQIAQSTPQKLVTPPTPSASPTAPASAGGINVLPSMSLKPGDTLNGEVLARYPNGNYRIRAIKRVAYQHGASRWVSVIATVRGTDFAEDDTVVSSRLFESRVQLGR